MVDARAPTPARYAAGVVVIIMPAEKRMSPSKKPILTTVQYVDFKTAACRVDAPEMRMECFKGRKGGMRARPAGRAGAETKAARYTAS